MRRERAHVGGARVGRGGVTLLVGATTGVLVVSAILAMTIRREPPSPNRRLAEAVGAHRVTRGRLTGGFAYAPCDSVTPNDSLISGLLCERTRPSQWPEAGALSKLAPEIRASSAGDSSVARRLHAIGAWHVVWGDLDAAIDQLHAAARSSATDAQIQSDLAVALLAHAERSQDPRSILEAYVAADSALALDSMLLEAHFNRAVALEWLHLRVDAVGAWSAYLELDGQSRWADEARARLDLLRVPTPEWPQASDRLRAAVLAGDDSVVRDIARRNPAGVRDEVRRATLEWAGAHKASGSRQDNALIAPALVMARAFATVTTDSLWADGIDAISQSIQAGEQDRIDNVANGILAYETGKAYLGQFRFDSAEVAFRESNRALSRAHNAIRHWAAYGLAEVAYSRQSRSGYSAALGILAELRASAPRRYRIVRGMAARTEGVIHGIAANFDAAVASYRQAVEDGKGSGDPGLEIRPHANLAGNYANLGQEHLAWLHLYAGIRASSRFAGVTRDVQRMFGRAADLSWRRSGQAALLFQREALRLAGATNVTPGDTLVMITALEREAELRARQGGIDDALESIAIARAYIARIAADSIRALYTADVDLVEAQAWLAARPESTARVLKQVARRYRNTGYLHQFARAQLLLANAELAAGNMDAAQHAFEAALDETERRRSIIGGAEDRARFLDQSRPLIDSVVSMLASRGDALGALEFMERMRARVLLERARGDSSPIAPDLPNSPDWRTLPAHTTLISYALLDAEVVAWLVRRDGIRMVRTPVPHDFRRLVDRFAELLATRASDPEARELASALYRVLVTPLDTMLAPATRLVFIPDKSLHFVPFAALYDARAKRFLVERFEIGVAPSVQLYGWAEARYRQLVPPAGGTASTVLAVGNPSFDDETFPLPRLPGAEREARAVAGLYERTHLLIGADATRHDFMRIAPTATVIHFAGHGVVRADAPLLSYLLFASDTSGRTSAMLTAQDLFVARFPRTKVAILSGCHTAAGGLSATEGPSSLARAFFATGVPAVVASLWAVDDEKTAEFFEHYHRALLQGDDPTEALRRTQLAWLAADNDQYRNASTWAAFTLVGATGYSSANSAR